MTLRDVLEGNVDLIEHAAALLADMPPCRFVTEASERRAETAKIAVTTRGVSRIDAYVDARPRASFDVADGRNVLDLPIPQTGRGAVELQGYAGERLAAILRMDVEPADG
jgi:hypothetical protein